jgi:NADH:ubiquinone oxidoreductase subunit E
MSDHYIAGPKGLEVYDLIARYGLDFTRGNVIKYVFRAGRKKGESRADALHKARHYAELERRTLPSVVGFDEYCEAFELDAEQKHMAFAALTADQGKL